MSRPVVWQYLQPDDILAGWHSLFLSNGPASHSGWHKNSLFAPRRVVRPPMHGLDGHGERLAASNPVSGHFRVVPIDPALEHAEPLNGIFTPADGKSRTGLAGMALVKIVRRHAEFALGWFSDFDGHLQQNISSFRCSFPIALQVGIPARRKIAFGQQFRNASGSVVRFMANGVCRSRIFNMPDISIASDSRWLHMSEATASFDADRRIFVDQFADRNFPAPLSIFSAVSNTSRSCG